MVAAKREKPTWGARKTRERLLRRLPHAVRVPARSTIYAMLDRHGLVTPAPRSRTRTEGTPLSSGASPNDLWCTDYKGEFLLGNRRYCYPLTVTDQASRYLLKLTLAEQRRPAGSHPVNLPNGQMQHFPFGACSRRDHSKLVTPWKPRTACLNSHRITRPSL